MENLSYLEGALHQLAYAIGGGLAGLLAARERPSIGARATIAVGLVGGGLAGLAVGYGDVLALTIAGALAMSFLGTSALIRVWAALADQHGPRRPVALTGLDRGTAVALVSALYAANLVGRLLASRLTRRASPEHILALALVVALLGVAILLGAESAAPATVGVAIAGMGIAATFPMASALHVQASGRSANSALGQTLTIASIGQITGPFAAGVIAQASDLRVGLLILPVLVVIAAVALSRHRASA